MLLFECPQISDVSHPLKGNEIVYLSDVVGASPVRAAPTTSSFSTNTWLKLIGPRQLQDVTRSILVLGFNALLY